MTDTKFMRTAQAAKRIGLAKNTLEKMRVSGEGPPFVRISPRRIVYEAAALDSWIKSRGEHRSTSEYLTTP